MNKLLLLIVISSLLFSCATVVNNSNFDVPSKFEPPARKKSISITVFEKLYDKDGEFYGYGYKSDLTNLFVNTFKRSKAFTRVAPLTSTCSESYVCLDIPTSKKVKMQRHVNIVIPKVYPQKELIPVWKFLSAITLGIVPAYYDINEPWEVNMFNSKREELYSDDTTYEGKVLSAVWLHYRKDKTTEKSKDHYDIFYKRMSKKILWNVLFQLRQFP